jgi:hypothetical protein
MKTPQEISIVIVKLMNRPICGTGLANHYEDNSFEVNQRIKISLDKASFVSDLTK